MLSAAASACLNGRVLLLVDVDVGAPDRIWASCVTAFKSTLDEVHSSLMPIIDLKSRRYHHYINVLCELLSLPALHPQGQYMCGETHLSHLHWIPINAN